MSSRSGLRNSATKENDAPLSFIELTKHSKRTGTGGNQGCLTNAQKYPSRFRKGPRGYPRADRPKPLNPEPVVHDAALAAALRDSKLRRACEVNSTLHKKLSLQSVGDLCEHQSV